MAIKPPNYQKDAVPTNKGWQHPKTGELLVSTKISNAQINDYLGVTPEETEAVIIDMTADVQTMSVMDMNAEGKLLAAHVENLNSLTKAELEELGREYGIELDRRLKKETMIEHLLPYVS